MSSRSEKGEGTRLYQFLEMVAVSGELTADMAKRLPIGSAYLRKCIGLAKKRRLVTVYNKDKIKGYRLTTAGKDYLLYTNRERFQFFLTQSSDTNLIRTGLQRRMRLHKSAGAYLTMKNAGIEIFQDKKPNLSELDASTTDQAPLWYYSSREIKSMGQNYAKVKNSRSVGVLVAPDDFYIVYNTGGGNIRWFTNAESRLMYEINYLMSQAGLGRDSFRYNKGIMLADSLEQFEQFLPDKKDKAVFPKEGGGYWNMHWIPNTSEGEAMLRLLCDPELQNRLNTWISKAIAVEPMEHPAYDCDGMINDEEPVLFCYTMDMARFFRLLYSLQSREMDGYVVCFDFQLDLLEKCCGEISDIQFAVMDFQKIRKQFGI